MPTRRSLVLSGSDLRFEISNLVHAHNPIVSPGPGWNRLSGPYGADTLEDEPKGSLIRDGSGSTGNAGPHITLTRHGRNERIHPPATRQSVRKPEQEVPF